VGASTASAAKTPTPAQKAAIIAAFRSQQGDVAIQNVVMSTSDGQYASMKWGFATHGYSAYHNTVLALADGKWRVLWTRDWEQPADGACVYAPAPVVRELFGVGCPPQSELRGRAATDAQLAEIRHGFLRSRLTPYARSSTGLTHACVSTLDPTWAAAAVNFASGSYVYVWFRLHETWTPSFDSLLQIGSVPPSNVVLSLASCVGYNPSDYEA
jgi:hypothetical protein